MTSRESRGAESQLIVAEYLIASGWPKAKSAGHGPGRDIRNALGLAFEVKSRRDFNPTGWMRQAALQAGKDLPIVVMRPDGGGASNVAKWPVILHFSDAITLLRDAGYGAPDPTPPQDIP